MSLKQGLTDILARAGVEDAERIARDTCRSTAEHMERNSEFLAGQIAEIARRFRAGDPPSAAEIEQMAREAAQRP